MYVQHMAYEYARKGARLALAARREDRLQEVADRCRQIGCHDVIVIRADVSEAHDCKRMVDQTLHHFHRCNLAILLIKIDRSIVFNFVQSIKLNSLHFYFNFNLSQSNIRFKNTYSLN